MNVCTCREKEEKKEEDPGTCTAESITNNACAGNRILNYCMPTIDGVFGDDLRDVCKSTVAPANESLSTSINGVT